MAEKNPFPGENNTGHIWDDNLRELANPPPRWWMIAFWASVAWWVIYGFIYPMWPIGHEPTKGFTGWSQMKEYQAAVDDVEAVRGEWEKKIAGMSAAQIMQDNNLLEYVQRSGKVYQPQEALTQQYQQNFALYKQIYPALKPVNHDLFARFRSGA